MKRLVPVALLLTLALALARPAAAAGDSGFEAETKAMPVPPSVLTPGMLASCPTKPLFEKAARSAQARFPRPWLEAVTLKTLLGKPRFAFDFHPTDGPERYPGYVELSQAYQVELSCDGTVLAEGSFAFLERYKREVDQLPSAGVSFADALASAFRASSGPWDRLAFYRDPAGRPRYYAVPASSSGLGTPVLIDGLTGLTRLCRYSPRTRGFDDCVVVP